MSSVKPLKIGIIGAGMYAATSHLPALREKPGIEIVAACRTRESKVKRFCEQFDVARGYTDHREMLAKEQLDAAVVASPHALHCEHTLDCLDAGLPVLLEKPMTLTLEDADKIQAKADETGLPVVVGYNRHWWPAFVKARDLIKGGAIGEPRMAVGEFHANLVWAVAGEAEANYKRAEAFYEEGDPPNFRGNPEQNGGGYFIDCGTHIVETICWMLDDDPVQVSAMMDNRGLGADLDSLVNIRFRRGAMGTVQCMGATVAGGGTGVKIFGTEGTLHLRDDSKIWMGNAGEEMAAITDLPPMSHPAHNFVDVMRGEGEVECSIADGRRAVAAVSGAYESAKRGGQPISVG